MLEGKPPKGTCSAPATNRELRPLKQNIPPDRRSLVGTCLVVECSRGGAVATSPLIRGTNSRRHPTRPIEADQHLRWQISDPYAGPSQGTRPAGSLRRLRVPLLRGSR